MAGPPADEEAIQRECLNTAPGSENSGRTRYAAAMYFFQRGMLSSTAIEIFRSLARDDIVDPLALLRAAGCEEEIANLKTGAGWKT